MSERPDLPRIIPDERPSYFNEGTFNSAIFGAILGDLFRLGAALNGNIRAAFRSIVIGTAVGAVIGGITGKKQQEQEQVTGRVVSDPSYFNTGIINGWLIGDIALRSGGFGMGEGPLSRMSLGAYTAVVGACMAIASIFRQKHLQHDYDRAIAVRDGKLPMPEINALYKNSVTPAEAEQLQQKQQQKERPVSKPVETTPVVTA